MAVTESPADDVLRYYSARAAEYDSGAHHRPEREPEVRYLEEWIPGFFAGKRVLEVACGTGHWTRCIASVASSLVAIDASREMLEVVRARIHSQRVRFALADAYRLSEELGVFEAAFAGFWLSHVPRARIAEFLQSLHHRLEPGATVVLVDNSDAHSRDVPAGDEDADGNTFQMRHLASGSSFKVLKNFPTEAELTAAIQPFGANARYWKLSHFWVLTYESKPRVSGAPGAHFRAGQRSRC